HPEAAALAGESGAGDRSRAMSLFAVGGAVGQALGPIYSGRLTTQYGLHALAWSATWGLALVALLAVALRRLPEQSLQRRPSEALKWSTVGRARGAALLLLLAIGVLRVLTVLGLPMALAFLLKDRGRTNEQIGLPQSLFLAGTGAGGLLCALLVGRGRERR